MDFFLNNHLVHSIMSRIHILCSYVIDNSCRMVAYRMGCINLHNASLPILKKHTKIFSLAISCELITDHVKMDQRAILCTYRNLHFLYNAIDMLQFLPGKTLQYLPGCILMECSEILLNKFSKKKITATPSKHVK